MRPAACCVLSSTFSALRSRRPALAQGRISDATDRDAVGGAGARARGPRAAARRRRHLDRLPHADGRRTAADVLLRHDLRVGRSAGGGMCRLESGGGISMNTATSRDLRAIACRPRAADRVPGPGASRERRGHAASGRSRPTATWTRPALPLVWLTDVKPDDSVAWLASLVAAAPESGEGHDRVGKTAMARDRAARRAGRRSRARRLRRVRRVPSGCAATRRSGSASTRGEPGARLLARMMAQDPSDKVRDKVDVRPVGQQVAAGADDADRRGAGRQEHQGPRPGVVLAGAEGRQARRSRPSPTRSTTIRRPRSRRKRSSRSASCRRTRACRS